jgi:hypothetical protein
MQGTSDPSRVELFDALMTLPTKVDGVLHCVYGRD